MVLLMKLYRTSLEEQEKFLLFIAIKLQENLVVVQIVVQEKFKKKQNINLINLINQTMNKLRVGNKQNSFLNGEWAGHVRHWGKKITSGIRRAVSKKIIYNEIKNNHEQN